MSTVDLPKSPEIKLRDDILNLIEECENGSSEATLFSQLTDLLEDQPVYIKEAVIEMHRIHSESFKRAAKFALWLIAKKELVTKEEILNLLSAEQEFLGLREKLHSEMDTVLKICLDNLKNKFPQAIVGLNLYSSFAAGTPSLISDLDVLVIFDLESYRDLNNWEDIQKDINNIIEAEFRKALVAFGFDINKLPSILKFPRRIDSFPSVVRNQTLDNKSFNDKSYLVADSFTLERLREVLPNKFSANNSFLWQS